MFINRSQINELIKKEDERHNKRIEKNKLIKQNEGVCFVFKDQVPLKCAICNSILNVEKIDTIDYEGNLSYYTIHHCKECGVSHINLKNAYENRDDWKILNDDVFDGYEDELNKIIQEEQKKKLAQIKLKEEKKLKKIDEDKKKLEDINNAFLEKVNNCNDVHVYERFAPRKCKKCDHLLKEVTLNKTIKNGEMVEIPSLFCSYCEVHYLESEDYEQVKEVMKIKSKFTVADLMKGKLVDNNKDFAPISKSKETSKSIPIRKITKPNDLEIVSVVRKPLDQIVKTDNISVIQLIKSSHNHATLGHEVINVKKGMIYYDPYTKISKRFVMTLHYCKECNRYFDFYDSFLGQLRDHGIRVEYLMVKIVNDSGNQLLFSTSGLDLRDCSKLRALGYSANANISKNYRQSILKRIIDLGLMSKAEIKSHLQFLINYGQYNYRMDDAVVRWRNDIQYINSL